MTYIKSGWDGKIPAECETTTICACMTPGDALPPSGDWIPATGQSVAGLDQLYMIGDARIYGIL